MCRRDNNSISTWGRNQALHPEIMSILACTLTISSDGTAASRARFTKTDPGRLMPTFLNSSASSLKKIA